MSHWLEEAEKRQDSKLKKEDFKKIVEYRRTRIRENFRRHGEAYNVFREKIAGLVDRVNALPAKEREPFGKITLKIKDSKLKNQFYFLRTSLRQQRLEWHGFKSLIKPTHYKHVRALYFSLSTHDGFIHIELSEHALRRERITDETHDRGKGQEGQKEKNRHHFMYRYEIARLDEPTALQIIDWLTFHVEKESLPFTRKEFLIR
ncbi:MAG: hypothetical protein KKA81_08710 [Bacteroidetes bacterium]|nr:hypothetical protein [Bacteroidota bacterium]